MGQSVLFAVLLLTLAAAGCQAYWNDDDYFYYLYPLYQRLEASLVNNSQMLYTMRQAFFPLYRKVLPSVSIKVCTEVREIQSESCNREGHNGEPAFSSNTSVKKWWRYQWSSSSLLAMITVDELLAIDNVFFPLLYGGIGPSVHHGIHLTLQPESLPCMPSASEMETTLITLLSWIKAYTKAHGIPESWNGEDRGYVAIEHDFWITEEIDPGDKHNGPHFIRVLLLALFIFLNILVVMVSAQFAPRCYNKLKQTAITSEHLLPFYRATAVVLGCFNTLILIFSLEQYRHHPKTGVCILQPDTRLCKIIRSTDMYTDLMAAVIAKIVLLPLALMVEFIIAAHTIKDTSVPIPVAVQKSFCCFFRCFSYKTRSKIVQTFALWHLMVSLQLVAMSAIPFSIVAVVSPGYTIPVLAAVISFILCSIISVAHLLQPVTTNNDTTSSCQRIVGIKIVRLLKVITFFVLLIALASVYFFMLRYGLSSRKGAAGYLFPLLPYLPLSAIGYYIKRKFFSSEANSNKSDGYGRSFEHSTNISCSVSDEGRLVEQQLVDEHQKSDTQALIDLTGH